MSDDVEKRPLPACRLTGLLTMIQRATDASLVQSLGVQPILVQGIGRNPKQWEGRVYFVTLKIQNNPPCVFDPGFQGNGLLSGIKSCS